MAYIQLSLFGRTSWELFHRETGWILEPCWKRSQAARFQCLLLNTGPAPVWCEGAKVISVGGSWTPSIGEAPGSSSEENGYSLWRILEESVAPQVLFKCRQCSRILRYAASLGCRPSEKVEYFLKKQGGTIPVILPMQERQMRGAVKEKDEAKFLTSFGRPDEPFPTLLASSANSFSFWYEGEDWRKEGGIRYLTPLECERLQGLPDHWTGLRVRRRDDQRQCPVPGTG